MKKQPEMKDNAAFWNKRSEVFDGQVIKVYEDAYRKTIKKTKKYLRPTDIALDIGCGTGVTTIELSKYVAELTAIDTSSEMMRQAVEKAEREGRGNIKFLEEDMFERDLLRGHYDVIMVFNVLLYILDQEAAFKRLYELLKPGGRLVIAADCLKFSFSKDARSKWVRSRTGQMPYVKFYTLGGLVRLTKKYGFQVVEKEKLFKHPVNLFLTVQKPSEKL